MRFHADTSTLRTGHDTLADVVDGLEAVMRRAESVVEHVGPHVGQDDLHQELSNLADTVREGHEETAWSLRILAGRLLLAAQEVERTDVDLAASVRTED